MSPRRIHRRPLLWTAVIVAVYGAAIGLVLDPNPPREVVVGFLAAMAVLTHILARLALWYADLADTWEAMYDDLLTRICDGDDLR